MENPAYNINFNKEEEKQNLLNAYTQLNVY